MSFILDALKKSEIDRQRQSGPGLLDAEIAVRHGRLPRWAFALGGLLAVNLVLLALVLIRRETGPLPAPPASAALPATGQTTPHPAPKEFSPLDAAPEYAPEIPVDNADAAATRVTALSSAPPAGLPAPRAARPRAEPLLTDKSAPQDIDEPLPSISELNLTGPDELPELHLDVHVFATNPADRFVYINMQKYREGATVQDGLTIEHIRRDGVVLNDRGVRFLLPRQ